MIIIGINGVAGSGKDTFADCPIFNDYIKLSFAGPLKEALKILFLLTDEQLNDRVKKEAFLKETDVIYWQLNGSDTSPRILSQWLGTDILRQFISKDFFVKHMELRLDALINAGHTKFIITDVRFDNEAEFIRSIGGIIVNVQRPINANATEHSGHASEQPLSDHLINHTFINDKETIAEYYDDIKQLFNIVFSF